MKRLLYPLIIFLFLNGCADIVNNPEIIDAEIKIQITKPAENDSLGYRGSKIEYDLKTSGGINFIELYVNNEFIQNFPPEKNQKPVIYLTLDSAYNGQKVELYLVYYDKNGMSTKSNVIKNVIIAGDKSVPFKPYNLSIIGISAAVLNISWEDSSRNVTQYEIWRKTGATGSFKKHLTAAGSLRNINDSGLSHDSIYYYKIRGNSANGFSEFSDSIGTGDPVKPFTLPPPSDVTVQLIDFKVIRLSWKDNSSTENYFKIERRKSWMGYETAGYTDSNIESFVDSSSSLSSSSDYYYRIKAVSGNDSSWSSEVHIFMPAYFLKAPSIISITNPSSRRTLVSWADNDQHYADFVIEKKEAGGSFTFSGRAAAYSMSFRDTVQPLNNYVYRVRQDDGIYTSAWSPEFQISTNVIPLAAPYNLNGYFDGNSVVISWQFGSDDVDYFYIERKDSTAGGQFGQVGIVPGNEKTFSDPSTICQHTYIYRVKAADPYSVSGLSNEKAIKNWKSCP